MKKGIKAAYEDPENSVDVFDLDRRNEFGGYYCIAAAVHPAEADSYWSEYADAE